MNQYEQKSNDRVGDWGLSATGRKFYPLDLRIEEIHVEDIAASLSKICRFGGHCREFYSVAQHSLIVCAFINGEDKPILRQALLHDATEAYCGDMIRPLKINMPEFRAIEQIIWHRICDRFNLQRDMFAEVELLDAAVLLTEKRDLLVESDFEWSYPQCRYPRLKPLPKRIVPLSPKDAESLFLRRCAELEIK